MPDFSTLPATIEALLVIALVVSPGYIFTKVVRQLILHTPDESDLRFLLTVITFGTIIQALAFPLWTSRILNYYLDNQLRQNQLEGLAWAIVVCLLLPLGLGLIVGFLAQRFLVDRALHWVGFGSVDRMPSAWDFIFRQKRPHYVRVHLKGNLE